MTQLLNPSWTTFSTFKGAYVFGLRNPTAGNQTIVVTFSGGSFAFHYGPLGIITFNGVDTTSDATAFPTAHLTSSQGTSISPSLSVTSAVGNMVAGFIIDDSGPISSISGTTCFLDTSGDAIGGNVALNYASGAASVTVSASGVSSADNWIICGVDIGAAASGPSGIPVWPFTM
jgi:hypothetical protein